MVAQELRIGNYVSAKTTSETFNVVSEIGNGGSGRGWYVRLENVNHGVWLEHNDRFLIEGIEITEEWLVKLLSREDFIFFVGKDFNLYFRGNFIIKIEYVHQLQNLYFALTGKDLTL